MAKNLRGRVLDFCLGSLGTLMVFSAFYLRNPVDLRTFAASAMGYHRAHASEIVGFLDAFSRGEPDLAVKEAAAKSLRELRAR